MVRECRPPAREPGRSWLARRSTMATSTPANANSPANISPVGPPPATTTACSAKGHPHPRRFWFRLEILQHDPGLAASALRTDKSLCDPVSGQVALAAATDMAGPAHRRHLETPSPEIAGFPGAY